mmetsp:Transcript_129280/g.374333  ORF Transcript_129280/g.374333 Transcript_129280/m.374333 type:complete len:115 (+) Transcript_129280:83-427(+)
MPFCPAPTLQVQEPGRCRRSREPVLPPLNLWRLREATANGTATCQNKNSEGLVGKHKTPINLQVPSVAALPDGPSSPKAMSKCSTSSASTVATPHDRPRAESQRYASGGSVQSL